MLKLEILYPGVIVSSGFSPAATFDIFPGPDDPGPTLLRKR